VQWLSGREDGKKEDREEGSGGREEVTEEGRGKGRKECEEENREKGRGDDGGIRQRKAEQNVKYSKA